MSSQELIATAQTLVADDKGLLAMDESNRICNKRFARLGIPQTEEAPRAYRELIVFPAGVVSRPTRRRWLAMPRCARKLDWSPSSSRKYSWTASIPWSGAAR
jgi:putative hemolysin